MLSTLTQILKRHSVASVLIAAFAFLYLQLFIAPITPVLTIGDQSIFLDEATRMLRGEVLYRDFFEFVYPGIDTVYLGLFRLFGVHLWIPDAILIALGVGLTGLTITIAAKLMDAPWALLSALLFLTFAFRNLLDATHHWYSTLAVMAALATLIDARSSSRLAAAGALCGLATWFTQSRGLAGALGFAVYLVWERGQRRQNWRWLWIRQAYLWAAFAVTVVALDAYFVERAGFQRFWYCTVEFALRYYPAEPFNNWRVYFSRPPHLHPWIKPLELGLWAFILALIPLVYVLFSAAYWTQRKGGGVPQERRAGLLLVNLTGLFLFLGVAPSPGYSRLCAVSPPAFILLAWLVSRPGWLRRIAATLLWAAALGLMIVEPVIRQMHWRTTLSLPTGRAAYLDSASAERFEWIAGHTHPGEYLFGDTLVCYALGLREPAEIAFVLPSDYTRPEQVRNLVDSLELRRVPLVLWSGGLDRGPAGGSGHDHLNPLRDYLRSHYHVVRTFASGDQACQRD